MLTLLQAKTSLLTGTNTGNYQILDAKSVPQFSGTPDFRIEIVIQTQIKTGKYQGRIRELNFPESGLVRRFVG